MRVLLTLTALLAVALALPITWDLPTAEEEDGASSGSPTMGMITATALSGSALLILDRMRTAGTLEELNQGYAQLKKAQEELIAKHRAELADERTAAGKKVAEARKEAYQQASAEFDQRQQSTQRLADEQRQRAQTEGMELEREKIEAFYRRMHSCKETLKLLIPKTEKETQEEYDHYLDDSCRPQNDVPDDGLTARWYAPNPRRVPRQRSQHSINSFLKGRRPNLQLPTAEQVLSQVGQALKSAPHQAMHISTQMAAGLKARPFKGMLKAVPVTL